MSKPATPTPTQPAKSFRARMGTVMRRSSSALSFTRPGTPSRSSTESLKLDSKLQATSSTEQVHSLPSPVPESPAREVAASDQEPQAQGPSKLSEPPIVASEPIDIPQSSPSPEPEIWTQRAFVSETPEPMSLVGSVDHTHEETTSSHAGDTESSAPTAESNPQPAEPSRPLPTEVYAEPWGQSREHPQLAPDVAPEPQPEVQSLPAVHRNPWMSSTSEVSAAGEEATPAAAVPTHADVLAPATDDSLDAIHVEDTASTGTTPRPIDHPSFEQSFASQPLPDTVVRSRTRASTVSSQVQPALVNGRLSGKPSLVSIASSMRTRADTAHVAFVEPQPETIDSPIPRSDPALDVRSPLEQTGARMPEPETTAEDVPASSGMSMPIAYSLPTNERIYYAEPIQMAPSGYSVGGKSSIAPTEPIGFDTDETLPLLPRPSAPTTKDDADYSQQATMPVAVYVQPGESSFWQTQSRDFQSLGWSEHVLPDGFTYFSHSSLRGRLTADIDLRNASKLDALLTFLDRKDVGETLAAPSEGWEVWLRDAGRSQDEFIAAKAWVYHPKRVVSLNQPPARTEDFKIRDEEKLEMEYRYWSFIETHPAHSPLPSEAIQEAIDALTWSYTDRLLPSSHSAPPPFTQEECQELIALLHSLDGNSTTQSIVRTRVIAKIFLRITTWRQGRSKHHATSNRHGDSHQRVPLRRTVGDFLVSIVCLGIPYIFLERSHHQRIDAESGMRSTAGPMLIVGACACVIAAIVLSASVTFISLPGLDDVARVAGFIAIILSASSLMSSVITLFRYKVDIERPPAYARGEGLVLLSRRSVLLSLPLVFLIWAIAAFITAVTLYAFRGLATTEHGGFTRHFQDYTQWAVVGTIGGLAGVLIMSTFLIHY